MVPARTLLPLVLLLPALAGCTETTHLELPSHELASVQGVVVTHSLLVTPNVALGPIQGEFFLFDAKDAQCPATLPFPCGPEQAAYSRINETWFQISWRVTRTRPDTLVGEGAGLRVPIRFDVAATYRAEATIRDRTTNAIVRVVQDTVAAQWKQSVQLDVAPGQAERKTLLSFPVAVEDSRVIFELGVESQPAGPVVDDPGTFLLVRPNAQEVSLPESHASIEHLGAGLHRLDWVPNRPLELPQSVLATVTVTQPYQDAA